MPYCDNINNPQCPIALGIFDTGATTFSFTGTRPDLEQAAYVQDLIRLGNWTVNAGLRWDHYQLEVNQNAVSYTHLDVYKRQLMGHRADVADRNLPDSAQCKAAVGNYLGFE